MRAEATSRAGRRVWATGAILALLAMLLALPSAADAYLYWATGPTKISVGRANNDGTNMKASFVTGGNKPFGVAVDSQHVYWTDNVNDAIGRANLDGTAVDQAFMAVDAPEYVVVDGQFIYWTANANHTIGRAKLDGTAVDQSFIVTVLPLGGIAIDGQFLYWGNGNAVARANIDGTDVDAAFIPTSSAVRGVAVDSGHLYWSQVGGKIGRANRDGSAANQNFIAAGSNIWGVAVDSRFVYWSDYTEERIGRANLDGTGVNQSFIPGVATPVDLEVDSLPHGSATAISCSPPSLVLPSTSTCTANVEDKGPFTAMPGPTAPTGTVDFSVNSGSFAPAPSCALVPTGSGRSACQVTFTPAGTGAVAIGASYQGDLLHGPSSGLAALTVNGPPVPAPVTVVPQPSNRFKRAKPMLKPKKGIAVVPVTVPGPGKLILTGKKLVFCAKQAKKAGQKVNLLALPTQGLKETLKEIGSAKAAFRVTFIPVGGEARTENGSVTLRLKQQQR